MGYQDSVKSRSTVVPSIRRAKSGRYNVCLDLWITLSYNETVCERVFWLTTTHTVHAPSADARTVGEWEIHTV